MAFNFCPNISLPENKQRIKEVGIKQFYNEYYKEQFDINPTSSVIDYLFVDINKFSISQQITIVNSIIYQIEQGKIEGYTNVNQLFDYAREIFNNTKESFIEVNDDGSWDSYIQKFNDIDENWDRFKDKTLRALREIGIKIEKTFADNVIQGTPETSDSSNLVESETTSPTEEFNSTEANYQMGNYDDNFNFSKSSKDIASAHLKLKLSLIPEVEYNGSDIEPKTNFLYMPELIPLDKVWSTLQRELTGLHQDEIFPRLQELAKENPMFAEVLNQIQSDPNTSIQNEFIVTFSKQQAKFVTANIGYTDKFGNRTMKVFGTNRQGANDIVMSNWYDNFKSSSPLIENLDGEYSINTDKAKIINSSFGELVDHFDNKKKEDVAELQKAFSLIGINLSNLAINNFAKYGTTIEGTKYSSKEFLNKYGKLIFKRLTGELSQTETDLDNKLDYNNPFISETTAINGLAKIELATNPFLYEDSFISGDGKAKYANVNNSYISRIFNSLTTVRGDKYIQDLLTTTYAANSLWGNILLNKEKEADNFGLEYFDTLGSDETNSNNKLFKNMSTKEKEFSRITLFQNQGRGKNTISKFFGLIPSDKTTLPVITANKVKVVVNTDNFTITNKEALDALYTPFIAEYNRISDVLKQNKNTSIEKIIGYHDTESSQGMGKKFLVYDFLNNDSEIFNEDESLKLLDSQTLKRIVTPKIQEFISNSIKEQLNYWDNLDIFKRILKLDPKTKEWIEVYQNNPFDKSYKKNLGSYENSKDYEKALASDYMINQFIANFNYTQLIGGDPALHGSKNDISKTWINYSKRLAKDIAPGLDGHFSKPLFTTIFLKDFITSSKQFEEYNKVLGSQSSAYANINVTDAQEYTTLAEHLAVMKAYGKLTPKLEEAGKRLLAGGENLSDIELILQPMKPVYVAGQIDKQLGINKMFYIKTSSFPLIPSLTKGLEIDKLRVAMENAVDTNGNSSPIDRAVYESGVKLGLSGNIQTLITPSGSFNDLVNNSIVLSRDGFRIQQEIPYHAEDNTINEGSQGRKLILSDIDNNDILNLLGHEMTGKQAKSLYENLHIEKMDRAFNQLISDFGVEKDSGGFLKITDLSKIQNVLVEEVTSRGYNINDIYGLQIVTDENGNQRFKIPLGFNNSSNRLESILNSLVTNRVIKQELPGFAKVQGSSNGFSKVRTLDQINQLTKDSIIWLNPSDTELNYIREGKDGKLAQADILLPSWFKDKSGKLINISDYIREDGSLDTDRIPDELLTVIGLRIPTQGLNSMMSFKVKGFLPTMVGDLTIVPAEITAQMGADFDVDKLFIYRYEYNIDENNNFSKIQHNLSLGTDISKLSDEQINNGIIQFFEDRYKDTSLLSKILEPNGFGRLPQLASEISKVLGLDSNNNFLLPSTQNEIHKNNNDGKAGTGIFSLYSTFIKSAQDARLELSNGIKFKIDDKIYDSSLLYGKGLTGERPSSVISYFQSASVDNAKEQILGFLNINSQTMDVAGTIALTGYDEKYIAYFLSQPIIREYVEALSNSSDITNPEYNPNREKDITNQIGTKYGIDNLSDKIDEETSVYSLEDMISQLSNTDNSIQSDLLRQFIQIKNKAKQIRLVQSAINIDTSGLGSRFVDLQTKQTQIEIVKNSDSIKNVENLFVDSTIGKASDVLDKSLEIFSQILPYNSPSYMTRTNKILELSGKADSEINSDDLNKIYTNLKSYIYSDSSLLNIEDINTERKELLYGKESLGDRWEKYQNSPAGKKNLLAERIRVRRGSNADEPIRLEAINTPAANNSDTNQAMASFYNMYYNGSKEEVKLVNDLVKYFILTGGQQGANSLAKYIPYDILEEYQFSNKLSDIDKQLQSGDYLMDHIVEQYFQHNPSKAISFNIENKSISNYTTQGFTLDKDSQYDIPTFNDFGEKVYKYPTYMSIYDRDFKNFLLYKLNIEGENQSSYSRIDTLGNSYINEFNANGLQYSLLKKNQSGVEIPNTVNTTANKELDTLPTEEAIATAEPIDEDYLTKRLSLDSTDVENTLTSIIDKPSTPEFANIARDLKRVLTNYPNIKINAEEGRQGIAGSYSNSTVSINLRNILLTNSKNPVEKTQRVILHELLHAITANKIDSYNTLSSEDKRSVDKLRALYNAYRRSVNQEELFKFKELTDKFKRKEDLNDEELQYLQINKEKYYALDNLHDFVAAGLTDEAFTKELKNNNFWTRVWDSIVNLLGLNKQYNNDYDALYNIAIELGNNDRIKTSYPSKIEGYPLSKLQEILREFDYSEEKEKSGYRDDWEDFKKENTILSGYGMSESEHKYALVNQDLLEEILDKSNTGDTFPDIINNWLKENEIKTDRNQTSLFDFNILTPREQKQEFLDKYHKKDGQEISLSSFDKINTSVKANDKYNNIRLDAPYENGKRVLRIYTRSGQQLDINPEPKSKEQIAIEKTIKNLKTIRAKFANAVNYKSNPTLQAKVADLDNRIAKIISEKSISLIINDINHRLDLISSRLSQSELMGVHDILESEKYLTFYKSIRDIINYNEAFEEENLKLDNIVRQSNNLLVKLKSKKKDLLVSWLNSRIKVGVNLNEILSNPQFDVGKMEQLLQSGAFSSSQLIQLLNEVIEDAQLRTNEDFEDEEHQITELVNNFLKENKNYNIFLQKDKNGKLTGNLINKYSQDYYDELQARKGNNKAYSEFYKANTKVELDETGKELYEKDLAEIKEQYPDWNQDGTHDKAAYTQWISKYNPHDYIKDYNRGILRNKTNYQRYVKERPIDKWLDKNYQQLKELPEDSATRQMYDLLDKTFKELGRKYGNQVNYIPEQSKDLITHLLQGNVKGGFSNIKEGIKNSLYTSLEPKRNDADLDINGVPHDVIPISGMNSVLSSDEKSYDLGRIVYIAKGQEYGLKHKSEVEPYLIMMKELIQDLPEYVTNSANEVQLDDNNHPILNTSVTRNANLNSQAQWIISDWLYNKGNEQTGVIKGTKKTEKKINSKGEEINQTKYITVSKISDSLGTLTRVKGMGLNVFSGVGNILYGLISNSIAAGDRKSFGEKEALSAFGLMLNASIPGTEAYSKVASLMKYLDVFVQTNELKYGQVNMKSPENPLKNLSIYEFQKRGEYFVQGQTAMAMLFNKKITSLDGKEYSLYDAFDSKGKWNTSKFGENPFKDKEAKRVLIKEIRDTVSSIHGDYARGLMAKQHFLGRALLIFRTWLPQSISVRFGKEYKDLSGEIQKGRYRSLNTSHALILPFIRDAYKAFITSRLDDNIDTRNMRKNAIEFTFIPILWAVGLMLKSLIKSADPDDDKELLTFILNSTTRAQGDLTFYFNPYSFNSTIREPIPVFKTLMDTMDLFPAVVQAIEGNDVYKSGIHKGQSKVAVKTRKALPIINQPDKLLGVANTILGDTSSR